MDNRIYSEKMIASMKNHLEKIDSKIITYPKFIFLCGAAYENGKYGLSNRGVIDRYIQNQADNIFIVLSEKLWEDSFNSSIDLLTFEDFLAEVSDCIILIAESAGSFCELGAFAYADKCFSDKLMIVVDEKYKNSKSFIMTGPVLKAKKDGACITYAPLEESALLSSSDLILELNKKVSELNSRRSNRNRRCPNLEGDKIVLSSFIIELLEMIKILQPISRQDLTRIYKQVKGFETFAFIKKNGEAFHNEIKMEYIMKLLQVTDLIEIENDIITTKHYSRMQNLMFTYTPKVENRERAKLLCRKYRYGSRSK